jgi:hypothetical protein
MPAGTRSAFRAALVLVTLAAALVVVVHAVRHYREERGVLERRFRLAVTVGGDGIAVVAVAWQLLAVLLVPACV